MSAGIEKVLWPPEQANQHAQGKCTGLCTEELTDSALQPFATKVFTL